MFHYDRSTKEIDVLNKTESFGSGKFEEAVVNYPSAEGKAGEADRPLSKMLLNKSVGKKLRLEK